MALSRMHRKLIRTMKDNTPLLDLGKDVVHAHSNEQYLTIRERNDAIIKVSRSM